MKAERRTITEKVEKLVESEVVMLTLTPEEARILHTITEYIGGDPKGPRGVASALAGALWAAGVRPLTRDIRDFENTPRGSLYLK
jgi:hypothetical protein